MTPRIFHAGFWFEVIDDRWEAFEKGFDRFDPPRLRLTEERFDALMKDRYRPRRRG
jgi:3-methyladenine DNA glycosylase Tag